MGHKPHACRPVWLLAGKIRHTCCKSRVWTSSALALCSCEKRVHVHAAPVPEPDARCMYRLYLRGGRWRRMAWVRRSTMVPTLRASSVALAAPSSRSSAVASRSWARMMGPAKTRFCTHAHIHASKKAARYFYTCSSGMHVCAPGRQCCLSHVHKDPGEAGMANGLQLGAHKCCVGTQEAWSNNGEQCKVLFQIVLDRGAREQDAPWALQLLQGLRGLAASQGLEPGQAGTGT